MPAPKGNDYWKSREKDGREKKYSPSQLWDMFVSYCAWVDSNPWLRNEVIKGGPKAGKIVQVPTQRPYTISGFCAYAGISVNTFDVYSKSEDYQEVTTRIREIAFTQKFEGAAVGAFNANIIARDLQLSEHKVVTKQEQAKAITGFKIVRKEAPNE